jgi:hypothetical protein
MKPIDLSDDPLGQMHLQDLRMPPGEKGSGAVRYAAAMYFYRHGMLGSKALEVYRTLAKDDLTNPLAVLRTAGCLQDKESSELLASIEMRSLAVTGRPS